MADFPTIEPFRRSYTFPFFSMEQEESWPGIETRYATGRDDVAAGLTLSLTYEDIREPDIRRLRDHWRSQMGGVIGFNIPTVVWPGIGTLFMPGTRWRYLSPPQETHRKGGWYDVTIELGSLQTSAAFVSTVGINTMIRAYPMPITNVGIAILPISGSIVTAAPAVQVAAGGMVIIPPAAPVVTRCLAPTMFEAGVRTDAPAGKVVTKPPIPRVVVGAGLVTPAGRSIIRGIAPTATAGGGTGASPYAAQIVTAFNVHVVGPIPGLLLPVPPARVVTRAAPSTVGNAGVVILPLTVPIITRGRGQAVIFSSAGLRFPPPGRTISRGRAPGAPGVGFVCPPSKVVLRGRVPAVTGG